jgi:succinate dehydrogenase/fumarate reductase cytochrome b subunit
VTRPALRTLHSFLGLVPLGTYLGFHAWELWPVRYGRGPALERLEETSYLPFEIALVVVPLLAHAGLGLWLSRSPDPACVYKSSAFRRFQAITGVVTLVFLLVHLSSVWLPRALSGRPAEAYGAMLDQVATLPGAALYVLGTSAVCVHFGQGLSAAWLRLRPRASPRGVRAAGVAVGVSLWWVLFSALATYATGAPLM